MGARNTVLVIGAGVAGLSVALAAAKRGFTVFVLHRSPRSRCNSAWAQGGVAAAVGKGDSPRQHAQDTCAAGRGLNDPRAVLQLTQQAEEALEQANLLDVFVHAQDGSLQLGQEAAHRHPRILHAPGGLTGQALMARLWEQVDAQPRIRWIAGRAVRLLIDDRGCQGAWVVPEGETMAQPILAAQTVLATGGFAGLYAHSTNPAETNGEGLALAYEAGATLADLEFVQFHPTAYLPPDGSQPLLLSEALRGAGAILIDAQGQRILAGHPQGELAGRDVVAQAVWQAEHGPQATQVFLSLERVPKARVFEAFGGLAEQLTRYGYDLAEDPVPIAPVAHFTMGGVCTDRWGRTNVPALWAVGEVACTGVHGANRLASNSLLEGLVFGQTLAAALTEREPATAAMGERPQVPPSIDRIRVPQLAVALEEKAGIVRDEDHLAQWEEDLSSGTFDANLPAAPLLLLAAAARWRTESRGAHLRRDFPDANPAWRGHIYHQRDLGSWFAPLYPQTRPVTLGRADTRQLHHERGSYAWA
ncbi:MAG: FAD-dependent oxidoreductase [Firmicutes bacterium]|nr:FAD-dependent oxidoreductase [Bacillota bacterium]